MGRSELIDNLNKALSLELSGVIQYTQHSFLITGTEREVYCEWFRDQAEEAQDHCNMLGDKIVALGGIPTVEPALIRQSKKDKVIRTAIMSRKLPRMRITNWEKKMAMSAMSLSTRSIMAPGV